jgi:hypothetical protein
MANKSKKKKSTKRRSGTVVVVGKKHRKRKNSKTVSGTTSKHRRKKKGFLGATSRVGLKEIAFMAVGVGTGAAITHIILRPVEKKLTDKWPMIGKFIAAGEVFLGGMIALKASKNFTKSLGVGILAGGVHGLMKQVGVYKEIPKLEHFISGTNDEYSEIRVPISGSMNLDRMLAGILEDSRRDVYTKTVAGLNHTNVVNGNHTNIVAGDNQDNDETFTQAYYANVKA